MNGDITESPLIAGSGEVLVSLVEEDDNQIVEEDESTEERAFRIAEIECELYQQMQEAGLLSVLEGNAKRSPPSVCVNEDPIGKQPETFSLTKQIEKQRKAPHSVLGVGIKSSQAKRYSRALTTFGPFAKTAKFKHSMNACESDDNYSFLSNASTTISNCTNISLCSAYNTPLQRKTEEARSLKRRLREMQRHLKNIQQNLQNEKSAWEEEIMQINGKFDCMKKNINDLIGSAREQLSSTRLRHVTLLAKVNTLERILSSKEKDLEDSQVDDRLHFYEMFKKGIDSCRFEMQFKLIDEAMRDPSKVPASELEKILKKTVKDLDRWKEIQLCEVYQKDPTRTITSVKEIRLNSLRDAVYHYLTQTNRDHIEFLLKVCINICEYSPSQRILIQRAVEKSRILH